MSDKFTTVEQRASYGIGRQMGEQLSDHPFKGMDFEAVLAGLNDAINGDASQVDGNAINEAFREIQARIKTEETENSMKFSAEGEKFLTDNATRDEVTVTTSGLQYEIINAADGDVPSLTSTVRTHYHGTLIDGTVFDSSYDRGQPAEFPVNGVIAGWTEALQLMGVGSKWRLYVPYQLAYGEQGAGGSIGPYSTLIFDVELLAIV